EQGRRRAGRGVGGRPAVPQGDGRGRAGGRQPPQGGGADGDPPAVLGRAGGGGGVAEVVAAGGGGVLGQPPPRVALDVVAETGRGGEAEDPLPGVGAARSRVRGPPGREGGAGGFGLPLPPGGRGWRVFGRGGGREPRTPH